MDSSPLGALGISGGGGGYTLHAAKSDKRFKAVATLSMFTKATGTADNELFLLGGAQHIETYWIDIYVESAVEKLTGLFDRTL